MVGPGLCVPPPPRPVAYCRSQASCCWTRQVRRHEPIPRAQREQPGWPVRHNLAGERGAGHWASVSPPLPANHTRRRGSGPPSPDAAGTCQQACAARSVAIAASHGHSSVAGCGVGSQLGLEKVHGVIGCSMGGMTAIAFASIFPEAVSRLAVTACTAQTSPVRLPPDTTDAVLDAVLMTVCAAAGHRRAAACPTACNSGRPRVSRGRVRAGGRR